MGSEDNRSPSAKDFSTDETLAGDSSPAVNARTGESSPDNDLAPGYPVGEYKIEEVLGRGGFGTVYRALQPVIGKRVAIKVLSRKYSADDDMVSRFTAEARAVNQIRHRHIIDIFSFGELPDKRQFYVMELLEGEPLDQYLATNGPLRLEQALPILRAVARALDAAHAKGVAHRDLKPENVFLARDDEGGLFPKLLDFGIAKLNTADDMHSHKTNTGVPLGTPYYMSPEQCRGQNVDHRTDIYSLGVLSYRLLTGKFPFDGNIVDILHHHMYDEPPPASSKKADLSASVDAALAWMMHKDPDARPRTAIAAVVALADDKTPTPMLSSLGVTEKVSKTVKRSWRVPAIALAVIAAGVVALVLTRGGGTREDPGVAKTPEAVVKAPSDAAPVAITPDAPAKSNRVLIEITGVPDGTEVSIGKAVVGTAPGLVQLDRSDDKMILTFRADGYQPLSKPVVPDKDQPLQVGGLKRKRVGGTTVKPPTNPDENPDGLIHVFGEEKKKR